MKGIRGLLWLLAIFALGFSLRAAIVQRVLGGKAFPGDTSLTSSLEPQDTDAYFAYAQALHERGEYATVPGKPSAHRPPLYPLFLAGLFKIFGARKPVALWANVPLGLLSIFLTYLVARKTLGARGALLASCVVACDPYLLISTGWLMTEAFSVLLFVLFLYLLSPRPVTHGDALSPLGPRCSIFVGLVFGALVLSRSAWPLLGVLPVFAILSGRGRALPRVRNFALFLLGFLVVYFPWVMRNFISMGTFVPFTTHGGYSLLVSNNENFYKWKLTHPGDWGEDDFRAWEAQLLLRTRGLNEVEKDTYCYREAFTFIRTDLRRFAHLVLIRMGEFWKLYRHRAVGKEKYISAFYVAALYILSAIGAVRLRGSPQMLFLLISPIVILTLVYGLYGAQIRYRLPLIPVLAILAGAAVFGENFKRPLEKGEA